MRARVLVLILIAVSPRAEASLSLTKVSKKYAGEPIEAFVVRENGKAPLARWVALPPRAYPTPGQSVPELASAGSAALAVNANFYREDRPGEEEPIGLVVTGGRLAALPNKMYPSAGVIDGKLDWDIVRADVSAVDEKGAEVEICRFNAPATARCASYWRNAPKGLAQARYFEDSPLGPSLGTHELAVRAEGSCALQLPAGYSRRFTKKIRLVVKLKGQRLGEAWQRVTEAVSGSHVISPVTEFPPITRAWANARQPRTLLGVDHAGNPFVAVIDGRREGSSGASVREAWSLLSAQLGGARWMLNLDGGGSTTLYFKGRLVNKPSDGYPRAVAAGFGAKD